MNCICAGYIREVTVHSKKYKRDETKFKQCVEDREFESKVEADLAAARRAGVDGTPAFFVNGILLSGAKPAEEFFELIDAELERTSS